MLFDKLFLKSIYRRWIWW